MARTPLQLAAHANAIANKHGAMIVERQNLLKDYGKHMSDKEITILNKQINESLKTMRVAREVHATAKKLVQFRHNYIIKRRESGIPTSQQVGINLLGRLTNVEKVMNVERSSNGLTITSDFEGLSARLQKKVEEVQDIFLVNCLESIKAKTPVDTGRARDGWYIAGKQILNDVPYVPYLEMGTEKMRPFAMVAATVANKEDLLARAVAEAGDL